MAEPISKIQSIRTILECVIVAALLWTGSTLVALKVELAQVSTRLTSIETTLSDVPRITADNVRLRSEVDQSKKNDDRQDAAIEELRKLKGFR